MSVVTAPELRQPVLGLPDPGERVPRLAWPTVALYIGTLALFVVDIVGLVQGWSPWATVPMTAAVTFLMFSVLHEATHHAVSTNTFVNDAFGHLSVHLVVPYGTFGMVKFIHIEHHRNTNEPKDTDPDAWTSEGPWWQLPFRWATIDLWYLVFYTRRIRERPLREVVTTTLVFVVVLGGFATLAATGHGATLLVYLAGQRVGLVVLAWWFDYLPHHGLTVTQREDKYRATRVRVGGEGILTPLFVYQNYHLVHHLHPSVPFYRYVRAWRRNEQAYLDRNAAISTWFGRSLTPNEYRTWRRLTDGLGTTPTAGSRRASFHPLRVRSVETLTADSRVVEFDVPADLAEEYRYVHGQHVTLRAMIDGDEVRRCYSIVSPVSAQRLKIAVKRIDDGLFSSYVAETLAPGDILDVLPPTGRFQTDLDPAAGPREYVAVAAGSGITPLMSIIATTLETEPESRFTLLYGNRDAASTMFADDLNELGGDRLTVHHVLSRSPRTQLPERITADRVLSAVDDPASVAAWFLCGPTALVDDVRSALSDTVDSNRVHSEVFHTEATQADIAVDVASDVTLLLDGTEHQLTLDSSGESILDAALQRGIDAPYSCAGGACGTCRAKVLLGRAVMDQNHALDSDEVDDGYVLTCQAHPLSEELRLDYDA